MRKRIAMLLVLGCLLLSGCQPKQNDLQTALDFRTRLISQAGCRFTAHVTADYGDRTYSFSLRCAFDGEDGELEVLAPEAIAGIRAEIDGEDAALSFDGVSLEYGKLAGDRVAPLTVPWLLGSAWSGDYIALTGREGDLTRVTWLKGYNEDELSIDTWLQEGIPTYAEVSHDGTRVLTVMIQDFVFGT